jgi:hypothetical protein
MSYITVKRGYFFMASGDQLDGQMAETNQFNTKNMNFRCLNRFRVFAFTRHVLLVANRRVNDDVEQGLNKFGNGAVPHGSAAIKFVSANTQVLDPGEKPANPVVDCPFVHVAFELTIIAARRSTPLVGSKMRGDPRVPGHEDNCEAVKVGRAGTS